MSKRGKAAGEGRERFALLVLENREQLFSSFSRKITHETKKKCWEEIRNNLGQQFMQLRNPGLPSLCGAIDGSLIKIAAPAENENQFVDRKSNHSINAMAVAGVDYYFYFFSCRWPGSLHDARVLRNSALYENFQNGYRPFPGALLIGDTGYPQLDWLLADSRMPPAEFVQMFQQLRKTRVVIEQAWGLYKARFQCTKRTLRMKPTFAAAVMKCCAILHNFLILQRDNWEEMDMEEEEENDDGGNNQIIGENLNRLARYNNAFMNVNNLI